MNKLRGFAAYAGVWAIVLCGCAEPRPVIVENSQKTTDVHNTPGNAIEAIKAYEFEQRDLAVNNLQHVHSDLQRRILDMRAQSKSIASDSREDWNEKLTDLERKRDELDLIVTRMKFATHDKWADVKDSAVDNLEEVQDIMQKLQEIVND